MKVAIIRANPRKNGHTQKLTDLFIEGLKQGKAEVTEIDLKSKKINSLHFPSLYSIKMMCACQANLRLPNKINPEFK